MSSGTLFLQYRRRVFLHSLLVTQSRKQQATLMEEKPLRMHETKSVPP